MIILSTFKLVAFENGKHLVIKEDGNICKNDVILVFNYNKESSFKKINKDKLILKKIFKNDSEFKKFRVSAIIYVKNYELYNLNGAAKTIINYFRDDHFAYYKAYFINGIQYDEYQFYNDDNIKKLRRLEKLKTII